MRIDAGTARTWVIGTVAAWALIVLVLALAGLGGRIAPLAEDPALVQPLPQAAAPAQPRLGPLGDYEVIGTRALFSEDRRHHPFFIDPQGEGEAQTDAFDFVLTSVLIAPGFEMAIVQPSDGGDSVRVRVGDAPRNAPAWQLVSLAPRSAVFSGPEGERTLQLRVFDGTGGQAPTASRPQAEEAPAQPARREVEPGDARASLIRETAPPTSEADQASQAEAIRRRIEARRARLREQQQSPAPTPARQNP